MPAIQLCDLHFTWPGRSGFSLEVPNFSVDAGEKVFLFGDSGSGKSTLLSLICGIVQPQIGRVEVCGIDLADLSGSGRDRFRADNIGVIFQMFNLLPFATGLENILLPLAFSPERRSRLNDERAEAFRLASELRLDRDLVTRARAGELSIGQQQRVAVARALIGGPRLVVADEPTSALDANAQTAFVGLLMRQVEAAGSTLIMVSHDKRLAHRFDRVLDLSQIASIARATS